MTVGFVPQPTAIHGLALRAKEGVELAPRLEATQILIAYRRAVSVNTPP